MPAHGLAQRRTAQLKCIAAAIGVVVPYHTCQTRIGEEAGCGSRFDIHRAQPRKESRTHSLMNMESSIDDMHFLFFVVLEFFAQCAEAKTYVSEGRRHKSIVMRHYFEAFYQ